MKKSITLSALCLLLSAFASPLPCVEPAAVALDAATLSKIDTIVAEALTDKKQLSNTGCVVVVGRNGKIAFLKAYGDKKTDTVFNIASITKPVATSTAIMVLVDRGKLKIDDPVAKCLTEFDTPEKREITIRHLLTHTGGFPEAYENARNDTVNFRARTLAMNPVTKPGAQYNYSCSGMIMLQKIVERLSGQNLEIFTQENIFRPLGMTETGYFPDEKLVLRAAPIPWSNSKPGKPSSWKTMAMGGGPAGHADLFSTATDLARFATMMLNHGSLPDGVRVLSLETVKEMASPNPRPPGLHWGKPTSPGARGLGWVMWTEDNSDRNRPTKMSKSAYGHGGYTGCALWMDPQTGLFTIFLSNAGSSNAYPLASRIGDIAVESIKD